MKRLVLSVLLLVALPASARDISGSLVHLARTALPDDALIVIELATETGVVAEMREPAGGRQVPLPFRLSAQTEGPMTLSAAIFLGSEPLWTAATVMVAAGAQDVDLGEIPMSREVATGGLMKLVCGETPVEIAFVGSHARLRADGQLYDLAPLPAASGLRFGDGMTPATEFSSKDDSTFVTINGKALPACGYAAPPSLLPLVARGNEPGWVARLTTEGITLSTEDGTRLAIPLPDAERLAGGVQFDGGVMVVTVTDSICHDSMTDMPYPHPVTVVQDGRTLQGCGGDPAALLAGRWHLLRAGEWTLPPEAEILFEGDRVSGRAACNGFSGGVTLTGEALSFGAMATTRMACGGGLMQTESAVLGAFGKVDRFDISDTGHLLLMAGDRILIEAAR